jgi:hypothetical protein
VTDGFELMAVAESWGVVAEVEKMICGCNRPPVVSGYQGQVRDITIDWKEVARLLGEDVMMGVVWSRMPDDTTGDATIGAATQYDLEATCRIIVGTAPTVVQAVATFGTGQTARQLVAVLVDR